MTARPLADVIDLMPLLAARRLQATDLATRAAAEPVRFITPELVEALQGSWGDLRPNTGPARPLRAVQA